MGRSSRNLVGLVTVMVALVLPSAASAFVRVAVVSDPRGGPDKIFEVADSFGNGDIRLVQENQANGPAIAIISPLDDGFQLGAGCGVFGGPPRARCNTAGVGSIAVNLAEGTRPSTLGPDTNRIDLTGVTQSKPDGSAPLPIRLTGGPGPDTVTDGPGVLSAFMLGGNDVVDAGAGDDDVDDGAGNDIVLAGEGNDRFGDFHTPDSDILSGGAGRDQVFSRGIVTLGDLLCNDGANGDKPPSTGTPRSVSAPEGRLECSGSGADRDLLAGIEAVSQLPFDSTAVDFTGSGADEILAGQQGSDRLEGGGGVDSLLGFEGNDLLIGRDGLADARIDCGTGVDDRAVVDQIDPVEPNCTTIERGGAGALGPVGGGAPTPELQGFPIAPPPSPPLGDQPGSGAEGTGSGGGDGKTPPELEIPTRVAFVKGGRVEIRVRCVYRAADCVGKLTLEAAQAKEAGGESVRKGEKLASGKVDVPWGTSKPTKMKAPRDLVRLLGKLRGSRTLKVKATVVAHDGGGGPGARSARASRNVDLALQR